LKIRESRVSGLYRPFTWPMNWRPIVAWALCNRFNRREAAFSRLPRSADRIDNFPPMAAKLIRLLGTGHINRGAPHASRYGKNGIAIKRVKAG
jgi:hypothetical protein